MQNGFLYVLIKFVIDNLCLFNLVEYFKKLGKWLNPDKNDTDKEKTYERCATDFFVVFKWIFIIIIWWSKATNPIIIAFVWYLIITNLYTYFFHHIWSNEALNTSNFNEDRIRRRFVNLILAVAYSDIAFAFLYRVRYASDFSWGSNNVPNSLHALWFSISNSFAANYAVVSPNNGVANNVAMIQLLLTFVFVTIIISRSIPQKT